MQTSLMQLEKVCTLGSRTIHLEGLDAGIVLEQSQAEHNGPLVSRKGIEQPILALASLDKSLDESRSMLGWVCWDEFVNLKNPYSVRWMEKCNDQHIAALRIIMRITISEAVSSRKINLAPSSPATGQLMGYLLMSAMMRLAATRKTPPTATEPDDTTTLLMRGLFGNLLTTAGSGVKPTSFCWQLFGALPQLSIPSTPTEWNWYEVAAKLVPYTAWPLDRFKTNLACLLDKAIFRVITNNEGTDTIKKRKASLDEYCKPRNIQLLHSRTIITILKMMLTEQDECEDVAKRLLDVIPATVKNETESYRRLHRYIEHLARGGQQRIDDNLLSANVFTKRSASFRNAKKALSDAASKADKENALKLCQEIMQERAAIEKCWGLNKDTVHVQNLPNIKALLEAYTSGTEVKPRLVAAIKGDSEQNRLAWQTGQGQDGEIEELDVTFMNQVLYGNPRGYASLIRHVPGAGTVHVKKRGKLKELEDAMKPNVLNSIGATTTLEGHAPGAGSVTVKKRDEFEDFEGTMKLFILNSIRAAATVEDVSGILGIPPSAMIAFATILAPDTQLESLAESFKVVMLSLLRDRARTHLRDRDRYNSIRPTMRMLGIVKPMVRMHGSASLTMEGKSRKPAVSPVRALFRRLFK
jgi:hypothetical protein